MLNQNKVKQNNMESKKKISVEEVTEDLSKLLADYIDKKVGELAPYDDRKWKNYYLHCIETLEHQICEVKEVIADYKENNFTANVIEQEGYLHGLVSKIKN